MNYFSWKGPIEYPNTHISTIDLTHSIRLFNKLELCDLNVTANQVKTVFLLLWTDKPIFPLFLDRARVRTIKTNISIWQHGNTSNSDSNWAIIAKSNSHFLWTEKPSMVWEIFDCWWKYYGKYKMRIFKTIFKLIIYFLVWAWYDGLES